MSRLGTLGAHEFTFNQIIVNTLCTFFLVGGVGWLSTLVEVLDRKLDLWILKKMFPHLLVQFMFFLFSIPILKAISVSCIFPINVNFKRISFVANLSGFPNSSLLILRLKTN